MQAKKWNNIFKALKEKTQNSQPRIFYTEKISFKNKVEIKAFSDIQKLKKIIISISTPQEMLKEKF